MDVVELFLKKKKIIFLFSHLLKSFSDLPTFFILF
jgi:hypothetical protein